MLLDNVNREITFFSNFTPGDDKIVIEKSFLIHLCVTIVAHQSNDACLPNVVLYFIVIINANRRLVRKNVILLLMEICGKYINNNVQ